MDGLKKHLQLFPPRLRNPLSRFSFWESICEIRLRAELPLSLTSFKGNIFLGENGNSTSMEKALRCGQEEIRALVGAFCNGNLYRYFDTLKDGFLVDEDGYRLGVCPKKEALGSFLPEGFVGANLRIPRNIPDAANDFLHHFSGRPLASTLILSPPGCGKTTLLRSLAVMLSREGKRKAMRVAVVDERKELFPSVFLPDAGLCDILSGYPKAEGISIATRVFSPEALVCDEIGSMEEAQALLSCGNGGSLLFASAHGGSLEEGLARPWIQTLLEGRVFSKLALLERVSGNDFRTRITFQELS